MAAPVVHLRTDDAQGAHGLGVARCEFRCIGGRNGSGRFGGQRGSGIGLAPRVHRVDSSARSVTLACGAIMAFIDAPFGWHAIDDGRRVLVFEPTSQVQLNFSLLERPEGGFEALMDALEAQSRSDYPATERD